MATNTARGVYLRALPDGRVPVRHSSGARRRAGQLQAFLLPLREALPAELLPAGRLEVLVVGMGDWRRMFSRPYGLPFVRTSGASTSVVGAADFQPRLLHRFDDLLLRAGRAGKSAPGEVKELLDLMFGHEWARAVAARSGLGTRVRRVDEFVAGYLFLQALEAAGAEGLLGRVLAWAEVATAAFPELEVDGGSSPRGGDPGQALSRRALLTGRAAELRSVRGWSFPLAFREALAVRGRGAAQEVLIQVEPTLAPCFEPLPGGGEGAAEP